MTAITKRDLCEVVGKETGCIQTDCLAVLHELMRLVVFYTMEAELMVEIRGFGSFYSQDYKQHIGRNPRTGVTKMVPAHRKMKFRVSPDIKIQVDPPKWLKGKNDLPA